MPRRLPQALLVPLVLALAVWSLQGLPATASAPQSDPGAGLAAQPAARVMGPYNWTINTVDNGPNVGEGASLALAGRAPYTPTVSYYDYPNRALRVAAYNGSTWVTRTVDNTGSTGQYSALALAPSAPYTPAVAYYSHNGVSATLKFAAWNGTTWVSRTVDNGNAGTYPSLAIAADLVPHASYYDYDGEDLKYYTVGLVHGVPADIVTVLDSAGDVGWYTSLALDSKGNPSISYYDYTNGNLKHAAYSSGWTVQTVDRTPNIAETRIGGYTSLAINPKGFSHISYCEMDGKGESCRAIKYAVDGVSGWVSQTIPTGSSDMLYTSLAIAPTEPYTPHIAYYDQTHRSLMLATYDSGAARWFTQTVDSESAPGDAGAFPSIALAGGAAPRIAYNHIRADGSGNRSLRYAAGETACATPLSAVSLQAPARGITGVTYILTGTVVPSLATSPFTYTWQTTDNAPEVFTSTSAWSAVTRNWSTTGPKAVTFAGANCGGVFTTTQTIDITACRQPMTSLDLAGPYLGGAGRSYTFTASALPLDVTGPVTYTWQATAKPPYQFVGSTESAKTYSWMEAELGRKFITVTTESCAGPFTATHSIDITGTAYLPELTVPAISRVGDIVHYSVRSSGMVAAPAGHQVALYFDNVLQERANIATVMAKDTVVQGQFTTPFSCAAATCVAKVCANDTHVFGELNDNNNCTQATWSSDATPPGFIRAPSVITRSFDSATITWRTDEVTDGVVRYGHTAGDFGSVKTSPHHSAYHTVTLTSLLASTAYQYRVTVTDEAGNERQSADLAFQTRSVADTPVNFGAISFVPYDSTFYEFFTLRASTAQTANVSYLRFRLDGHDLGSDYAASPAYEVTFSPFELGYTRDGWYNQPHSVIVHGYNLAGSFNMISTTAPAPARPEDPYELDIREPHPNHSVWIPSGTEAPAGTVLSVTVRAAAVEWGCTWSGFSEGTEVPPGLDAVMCKDVDRQVNRMYLFLDGSSIGDHVPAANEITHTFQVNLAGKAVGVHTLTAKASVNGTIREVNKDFGIEIGAPSLSVFRQVTREGNALKVTLTLKNDGQGEAVVDKIEDSLEGLQQVNGQTSTYSISTKSSYWTGSERRHNRVLIDFVSSAGEYLTIPKGGSSSVQYWVLPILFEGTVTPFIGALPVKVTYQYDGQAVVKDFARPGTDVLNVDGSVVPLAQGLAQAMKESDYLLVTNPTRLYNLYNSTDVNSLLSEMAYLALLKNGALGYLKTYDAGWILDDLLDPDEGLHWTQALHPNFGLKNKGYVLIVGETEVVASWYIGHGYFTTYYTIPDEVYQSDLPYANISGRTARPEIALGRIVGNSAADLIIPIRASIGVAESEPGFNWDRHSALVTSGRGDGVDSNFVPTANIVEDVLNDEFPSVTKIHAKDYGAFADVLQAFKNALATGQDVIFFRNHGNYDQWSDVLYRGDVSGLDFAGHKPFAFAAACVAGNYEQDDGDNITNKLLTYGVGAYIGSTQLSERTCNDIAAKAFYRDWDPGMAVGVSLNNAKIAVWDTDSAWESFDHEKLWAYEYNLYGDPKWGLTGGYSVSSAPAAAPSGPFDVHVPAFEVSRIDGKDHVTIPGGLVWQEPGQYQVPFYPVSYDYPAGQRVQAITLTARSGLVITAGLELPVLQPELDCTGCGPLPPVEVFSGAWAISPTLQYEWTVEQNPGGGSRLLLNLFPFYYNTETTGVLFYQDYSFDALVASAQVSIESLATGAAVYDPGEKAEISLLLTNAGSPTDVVIRTTILRGAGGDQAGSLPLTMMAALIGTASLNLEWDTTGQSFGDYTLLVELLDAEGNLLDEATRHLGLGAVSGMVGNLSLSTVVFDPGDSIGISAVLTNTGTVPLTGTAVIRIDPESGAGPTAVFTQSFGSVLSGATLPFSAAWNTSGAPAGAYRVTAYASYYSQTTDPAVSGARTRVRVFLPIVTRQ